MLPFRVEPLDIVIIVAVALLIFGPRQLPHIGRAVGKAISEFRQGAKEMTQGFREEVTATKAPERVPPAASSPARGDQACPKCGGRNTPDAQFCTHCGAPLASVSSDSSVSLPPPTD